MKTQLIQLDPSDDVISVRDKMGWSQTSRILLVWPEEGQVLARRLDLMLLQRHSCALGAQLALVTRAAMVREIADELHIPVFKDSRQAQNTRWRGRRRKPFHPRRLNPPPDATNLRLQRIQRTAGWQERAVARYGLFGASMLAILGVLIFFIPGARITLRPVRQSQSISLTVTASRDTQAVNLAGELPAQVRRVIVEGRASLPTTGSMLIPGEAAIGAAQFTNLTDQAVNVPEGLIISTLDSEPIRFFTSKAGVVAPGAGRTLTVPIQAMVPGEEGNLEPGSLAAIEGELGLRLSVTNLYGTHGGTNVAAPAPQDSDLQRLRQQLTAMLRNSALTDLQNGLAEGDLLLSTSLELADILEEAYNPPSGLPGDELELTLRLEYQAMVVREEDLEALATPVLDGSLAEGMSSVPGTMRLRYTGFSAADEEGAISWTMLAQRSITVDLATQEVTRLAAGQPAQAAATLLASKFPLADEPTITLSPAWWPRLPYLTLRIEVITE